MSAPASYYRTVSPPPLRRRQRDQSRPPTPRPAEIEAGQATVQNHSEYWFSQLSRSEERRSPPPSSPQLVTVEDLKRLYYEHESEKGCLFVVHQHAHPLAGLHYDLRLQFSKDSALSFSVPYGLPGNPNSIKRGRLAVETRVHCLWNHLVESASLGTGSLLIWDIGYYNVLPRKEQADPSDSDQNADSPTAAIESQVSTEDEPGKLRAAFQNHHMKLRLHGTRLPRSYTITMRLSDRNNTPAPAAIPRKRKRPDKPRQPRQTPSRSPSPSPAPAPKSIGSGTASRPDEEEEDLIRKFNAYPGAHNTINSVHQRQWYLNLDKQGSGFIRKATEDGSSWVRKSEAEGFDPFFVLGADVERSIVTGRTSADILADEGIVGYTVKKPWRPILE